MCKFKQHSGSKQATTRSNKKSRDKKTTIKTASILIIETSKNENLKMKNLLILATLLLTLGFANAQNTIRDPDTRKDYANVFWKKQYTLFDLITDKPIFPKEKNGKKVYTIYYTSNEDPKPYKGSFTEIELERHIYYKFKNKRGCKKFCKSKKN